VTGHVFEEHPLGAAFADNPGDLGPEMAWVVGTAALSGGAEGLAGISGEDDVKGTAKGLGIEAKQIVPDRGLGKISCALGGEEDGAGVSLPLHERAGVEAGFGEHDAQIQASAACAEG
jgi:hypothetical protein